MIPLEDMTIEINRGDRKTIVLKNKSGTFKVGDKLKFSIVEKKNYNNVLFQKTYTVTRESKYMPITLSREDMKIGDIISKKLVCWYEIEYNGSQTIVGYDDDGAKELILYPEAPDIGGND